MLCEITFKFHRWLKIRMELEVEAYSVTEALKLAERMIETENTSEMDTECSGLDLVEDHRMNMG